MLSRRRPLTILACSVVLAAPLLVAGATGGTAGASESRHEPSESPAVVLQWERIAMRTIYPVTPIPFGVPLLGFTSVAMYDAALASLHRGHSSDEAAVAVAGHDVLANFVPAAQATLDAELAASLAAIPDGGAKAKGVRIGREAARDMIESRVGDGFLDGTIHYNLAAAPGIWQPTAPSTDMLGAWLGSLRPLVLESLVQVDGPDLTASAAYAVDYDEVRRLGSMTGSERTEAQTATALFFNSNSATMVGDALVRHLEAAPQNLLVAARMFAAIHGAMTDSIITCWQLKRDVGFWRPNQAIAGADADGNDATVAQPGWTSLVPNPPYSDYVSGHACLTSPAIEVIRQTLGEGTDLELRSVNGPPRVYGNLSSIEHDAFHARIWAGLHFRDAMDDGYFIGHQTAMRVLDALE